MTQVSVELPETVYSVLHCSSGELDKDLRLAASVHWYQQGHISQESKRWAEKRCPPYLAKLQKQIEQVSLLPRTKQKFVMDMLDTVINQQPAG